MENQPVDYEEFPLEVIIEEDDSFTFKWDKEHPVTSVFNDWTEEDFTKMIVDACNEAIEKYGN